MSEAKKQNYLHGAAIMVGTTVIVKIAAFFYKLPLGSMKLLGERNWWLPKRLGWLPQMRLDGEVEPARA